MSRIIKFRFWNPDKFMMDEHRGWREDIGINEAIEASQQYGYKTMQFTGLQDKNGKDIYEGDLLEGVSNNPFSLGEKNIYEVVWGVDSYYIKRTSFSIQELRNYCNNNIEVIGNIYEHSHLINKN